MRSGRTAGPASDALERALRDAQAGPVDLPPGSLLNMETSVLRFNLRVLELARDPRVPLLERLRFLSIFGSNLDEFFMTRVAGFKRQVALGNEKPTLDGLSPTDQLARIEGMARELFGIVDREVMPSLQADCRAAGIELLTWSELSDDDRRFLRQHYTAEVEAGLSPVGVTSGPFPHVRNLRPVILVRLDRDNGSGERFEVIELPGDVPRLLSLPGGRRFVPLEEMIRGDLSRLFHGRRIRGAHLFRVTRSGILSLDAENVEDVVSAVAENLARRPFQPVVRLEIEKDMPQELRRYLVEQLATEARNRLSVLSECDVYPVETLLDLSRLRQIAELPIDELRYPRIRRSTPFQKKVSIFRQLREHDVLASFPGHTFTGTVERFVHQASRDPAVEAIRVTLYRTSRSSPIVRMLRRAHRNGKSVVALIEVQASFDERRNIEWGRALEAAGIRVLYGPPSIKVHAKIASIVRREGNVRRLYTYIGTGNLNAATAAGYTDLGLFTADPEIGRDIENLFATLAGDSDGSDFPHIIVAPFNMRRRFLELVEREIDHARSGRGGGMTVKLNGLADREMIDALYRASRAGVWIDLLVRGICALRPGVEGLSDRIRVVAIAGRYLEHARIFRFDNAGEPEYWIGSADWRGRNLSRRVEVVVGVREPSHRALLDRILEADLTNPEAWDLQPDGRYVRRSAEDTGRFEPAELAVRGARA